MPLRTELLTFRREATTGRLDLSLDNVVGGDLPPLSNAVSLTMSLDGKWVYVASSQPSVTSQILVFERDATDSGKLSLVQVSEAQGSGLATGGWGLSLSASERGMEGCMTDREATGTMS